MLLIVSPEAILFLFNPGFISFTDLFNQAPLGVIRIPTLICLFDFEPKFPDELSGYWETLIQVREKSFKY
jgi:hypothetical protein